MVGEFVTEENWLYGVLAVLVVSVVVKGLWGVRNGHHRPPCYGGWLPWVGCAVEFGKGPLDFIERKHKEMGPVFTLKVAGKRMTFLFDPDDFHHFFHSPHADMMKAVQPIVHKVFTMSANTLGQFWGDIKLLKGKLAGRPLSSLFPTLHQGFSQEMDKLDTGDYELMEVVRLVMYRTVVDIVFGKGHLPTGDQAKFREIVRHFLIFDEQFEAATFLPSFYLKEWRKSRDWLLQMMRDLNDSERKERTETPQTINQSLSHGKTAADLHCISLAIMWAALANAVPAMFWTLALVMANEKITEKARSQVIATVGHNGTVTEESLSAMPYLKCCVLEALRLNAPGIIIRVAVQPIRIKDKVIPAGDQLSVSPFWTHRDPRRYPDPDNFVPERWEKTRVDENLFMDGFAPFGGGRFQCPGRWFAMKELQLFLALFLQRFHCRLTGPIPARNPQNLLGIQQPLGSCPVHLKKL